MGALSSCESSGSRTGAEACRQKVIQNDRQPLTYADKESRREAYKQAGSQSGSRAGAEACRQKVIQNDRQPLTYADKESRREAYKQAGSQSGSRTGAEACRQKVIQNDRQPLTYADKESRREAYKQAGSQADFGTDWETGGRKVIHNDRQLWTHADNLSFRNPCFPFGSLADFGTDWETDGRKVMHNDRQLWTHADNLSFRNPWFPLGSQVDLCTDWEMVLRKRIHKNRTRYIHEDNLSYRNPWLGSQMSLTTTLKKKGNEKFENGDFKGALSCYTQILEISAIEETEKAVILKNRAMCRLKVDDFEGAVSDATKALDIVPNNHEALTSRCEAYVGLGKVQDACRDAALLLKVDPNNPSVKLLLNSLAAILRPQQETKTKAETKRKVETKTKIETMAKVETKTKVETKEGTKTETNVKVDSETKAETQTDKMLEKKGQETKTKAETKRKVETKTKIETMAKVETKTKVETKEGTNTETKVKVDSETKAETQTDKMLEKKGMPLSTTLKEEGNEKLRNGDIDGAPSCYTQALEISEIEETEKVDMLKNRAWCWTLVNQWQNAVADATKALEIAPNDPLALYQLVVVYAAMGKIYSAYREAAKWMNVASKNPLYEPLMDDVTKFIKQRMSLTAILKEEGDEKFIYGDFYGALNCYEEALKIRDIKDTENPAIFYQRAMCQQKVLKEDDDATKDLEIAPNDPKALYRRCVAYECRGMYQEAMTDAQMLKKVDPKNPIVDALYERLVEISMQNTNLTTICIGRDMIPCDPEKDDPVIRIISACPKRTLPPRF